MIATLDQQRKAPTAVNKRADNRRENLRKLIEDHDGPKELAKKLGYSNASFLVQMAGPNPTREVTEKSARKFERSLGLAEGALDRPVEGGTPAAKPQGAAAAQVSADTTSAIQVIHMLGQVCAEQNVTLPPVTFANVVEFALASGMPPSPDLVRRLLTLVKS